MSSKFADMTKREKMECRYERGFDYSAHSFDNCAMTLLIETDLRHLVSGIIQ